MINKPLYGITHNRALTQFEDRDKKYDTYLQHEGWHEIMPNTISLKYKFPNGYNVSIIFGEHTLHIWEVAILKEGEIINDVKRCKDFSRVEDVLLKTLFY